MPLMKLIICGVLSAVLAFAVPLSAEARSSLELAPTADWSLGERARSCVLNRTFEADGKQVELRLENVKLGTGFRVIVLTDDFRPSKLGLTTGFLPGEPVNWGLPKQVEASDGRKGVMFDAGVMVGTPQVELADTLPGSFETLAKRREIEVDRLLIGDVFSKDLVLLTGSMRPPMLAMRACVSRVASRLGVAPEESAANLVDARFADPEGWIHRLQRYFPKDFAFSGKNARIQLKLKIDADGNVSDCTMTQQFGPPEFGWSACRMAMQEKFLPALDAEGQPTSSTFQTVVNY